MSQKIFSMISVCSMILASPSLSGDALSAPAIQEALKKGLQDREKETRIFVSQVTEENQEVLKLFDQLQEELRCARQVGLIDQAGMDLILEGIEFATDRHKGQIRKNGAHSPYITHPLHVTLLLMQQGKVTDCRVIVASLLHDTMRDGVATQEEIEKKFGKQVALYVGELTDDKGASKAERQRRQIIEAAHQSPGAAAIKLADQLCNLEELRIHPPEDWSRSRIDAYYQWAQAVIDRLPSINPELKKKATAAIDDYWQDQDKKR